MPAREAGLAQDQDGRDRGSASGGGWPRPVTPETVPGGVGSQRPPSGWPACGSRSPGAMPSAGVRHSAYPGGREYRPLTPGTVLNNTYRVDAAIARGGMGEVYRATNLVTDETVAIKTIRPEFTDDPKVIELFRREALALRRVRNPAVVGYEGVFASETGQFYLAMEFVDGPSLSSVIRQGALAPASVRKLRERLAGGLAAAHAQGVIHRDLSPDNVILPGGRLEEAKLIDFGIAKQTEGPKGTMIGTDFAGKYSYVAPEQLGQFGGQVDGRSDIYSLGLILVAAAIGGALDMGNAPGPAVDARKRVPDLSRVPPELRKELTRMLQPDPARRPQSMQAVLASGSGAGVPWWVPATAAAVMLLLAGGGYWLFVGRPGPAATPPQARVTPPPGQTDDAARQAEERRRIEAARQAEERRRVEEARLAEERRRAEETARQSEEARQAEERRQAEQRRLAEERRVAEERRLAEERRQEEERRLAEERRQEEERRRQPPPPPPAPVGMSVAWSETRGSQDECIAIARRGVAALGFQPDVVENQTVFGLRGGHGVAVRCIASRNLAVQFAHGASDQRATEWVVALQATFRGTAGTPPAPAADSGDNASMSAGWTEIQLTQEQCMAAAQRGVAALGMRPNAVDGQTVFGWEGANGVAIRCIAQRNIAALFSRHPNGQSASAWIDQLRTAFAPGAQQADDKAPSGPAGPSGAK